MHDTLFKASTFISSEGKTEKVESPIAVEGANAEMTVHQNRWRRRKSHKGKFRYQENHKKKIPPT